MHPQHITRRSGTNSCNLGESQDSHQKAWRLIDALTLARKDYDLLPQSIAVLKALVSFLPKDGCNMIVWPSNATLCERALGMSERSLRRHIERLIEAGLVTRKTSSNGKRFALRAGAMVVEAFGFDLSGLFAQAQSIEDSAARETARQEEMKLLRAILRQRLHQLHPLPCTGLEAEILLALRHRDNLEALRAYAETLQALPLATEMTAKDSPIDRHIQNTDKESYSVKEPDFNGSLEECLEAIPDTLAFSPKPIQNWHDLCGFSHEMAKMIGISDHLMTKAAEKMGLLPAALTVLCLGQKISHIQRPVAYFHSLVQRAAEGSFSLKGLILSAKKQSGLQLQT